MKEMGLLKKVVFVWGVCLFLTAALWAADSDGAVASWPGEKSSFHSFDQYDFEVGGFGCKVVVPNRVAEGRPWIWRARFWGHEPQTDVALLNEGFHVVYADVAGLYGAPKAVERWDVFYEYLVGSHGFDKKVVLEGMSRGGLIVFNWAAKNPEKVHCIYADAPVCDFKSWPGINKEIMDVYGLTREQAEEYKGNPIDNLGPLAKAGVPLLHVVGDADEVVPVAENTAIVEARYKALGGEIEVIHKEGVGHHPHSLKDPKPIVDFILKYARRGDLKAVIEGRGDEAEKCFLAGDVDGMLEYYCDDVVSMPNFYPMVKGKADLKRKTEAILAMGMKFELLESTTVDVQGSGDVVYEIGTFQQAIVMPGGKEPIRQSGKFVNIWKRGADGKFRIAVEIYNSDEGPGAGKGD